MTRRKGTGWEDAWDGMIFECCTTKLIRRRVLESDIGFRYWSDLKSNFLWRRHSFVRCWSFLLINSTTWSNFEIAFASLSHSNPQSPPQRKTIFLNDAPTRIILYDATGASVYPRAKLFTHHRIAIHIELEKRWKRFPSQITTTGEPRGEQKVCMQNVNNRREVWQRREAIGDRVIIRIFWLLALNWEFNGTEVNVSIWILLVVLSPRNLQPFNERLSAFRPKEFQLKTHDNFCEFLAPLARQKIRSWFA